MFIFFVPKASVITAKNYRTILQTLENIAKGEKRPNEETQLISAKILGHTPVVAEMHKSSTAVNKNGLSSSAAMREQQKH